MLEEAHALDFVFPSDGYCFDEYTSQLVLTNEGEVTLRDLEVSVDIRCDVGYLIASSLSKSTLKQFDDCFPSPMHDPQYQQESINGRLKRFANSTSSPRVWPGASLTLATVKMFVPEGRTFASGGFRATWTVFLDDALPVRGSIDFADPSKALPE